MDSRSSGNKMDDGGGCETKEGGSDSGVETNGAAAVSCDSSLVSCCSEEALRNLEEDEGGSEASSVSSGKPPRTPRTTHRPSTSSRASISGGGSAKERSLSRGPHLARSVSLRQEPATKKVFLGTSSSVNGSGGRSPLDDGRWPSNSAPRIKSSRPHSDKKSMMSVSVGPMEAKDKFATIPRRRRNSLENLTDVVKQPNVTSSRDLSLNRTASLRRKKDTVTLKSTSQNKPRGRTRIYHEVTCQTALTSKDMEAMLSGSLTRGNPFTRKETSSIGIQVEATEDACNRLQKEVRSLQDSVARLSEQARMGQLAAAQLSQEREAKIIVDRRLRALLPDKFNEGEVVECIEKHCNLKNEICFKQQQEIARLQNVVVCLRRDLDKSVHVQRKMMEQQLEVEAESMEMQDFLQAEKSTLAETLKELETEVEEAKKALAVKENELEKQKEECSHLVRISEQRRQEKLALEARLRSLETNSRSIMEDQSSSISGAIVALTGLGAKLERLIEALVTSYNISQQDLEEVVYHNEVYCGSGGSSSEGQGGGDSCSSASSPSPEQNDSPHKAKSQGFLANIFKAIWGVPHQQKIVHDGSSNSVDCEMLFAEPEPASFLLSDATSPSKRLSIASLTSSDVSKDPPSQSDEPEINQESVLSETSMGNETLKSLSQAILLRQREEELSRENSTVSLPNIASGRDLVDLAIQVDNQVSRLLNIMHFVHKRKVDSDETRLSVEAASTVLKEEIAELNDKLESCSKSSEQVEVLQKAVCEKERELKEVEMKFELTQELLTNNWHKAMSEVKRQYESIDAALEALDSLDDVTKQSPALIRLQRELQGANIRSSTTLPVSSSRPDLNANPGTPTTPPATINNLTNGKI